jgi:hypothetical protein
MEVLVASKRLAERGIPHRVVYLLEPGRFRVARSDDERAHQISPALRDQLFPPEIAARLFVTHTRPEILLGIIRPLHTGRPTSGLAILVGEGR